MPGLDVRFADDRNMLTKFVPAGLALLGIHHIKPRQSVRSLCQISNQGKKSVLCPPYIHRMVQTKSGLLCFAEL